MDKELTDKEIDDVLANNSETDMNPNGKSQQVFGNYLGRMLRQDESRRDDPPLLIKILIGYFLAKPAERLQSKGIFRITSKWEQIKELEAHLNNGDYEVIEHAKQPQDIANLLKYTLKYLRIPLFPYKQYFDMGKQRVMDEAKRVKQVKGILAELKQTENGLQAYNTLKLIFLFFKEVDRNEP